MREQRAVFFRLRESKRDRLFLPVPLSCQWQENVLQQVSSQQQALLPLMSMLPAWHCISSLYLHSHAEQLTEIFVHPLPSAQLLLIDSPALS